MNQITEESWNNLINKVGGIGDKTQSQLVQLQGHISHLTDTLFITNIILALIAVTYLFSTIMKFKK
ncbi:hypothetical protein FIU87_19495 [Bacillus sp. THAF10]|uniref:hypothetical protein n=1 Tax=Bacillus sp. THAF10 TaxID=2587848 RepID=UPI0012691DB7|nr:hypothetical protein [Bacillus sp. THAF10]QFT90835.1 hypothetical protein FIU87_19495 [Bacillus sp. THAF10]